MFKTKLMKEKEVKELKERFEKSAQVLITDYAGINVKEITGLRRELRKVNAQFKVVKNTLVKRALAGTKYEALKEYFTGPVAVAFGESPVELAKIFSKFVKDTGKIKLKAGFFEGQVVNEEIIKEMANLPSKQELLAKLVGNLKAPVSNFIFVLSGIYRKFVYVLSEIEKAKRQTT